MQISTIVATALLPLLAAADTSTTTSTMTMTKYITIQRVATSSVFTANSTSVYQPTGTGSSYHSSSIALPTTTTGSDGTPTTVSPTVSPTIDNNNSGASLGSSHVALAGLAGIVVAALM
ncbi:hypothetical protein F5Y11DRAFT_156939 [Daldinia sp. FL1419]|nr:hypothetical protein F5Y11DRAFT_156939 [Daldinia sp. FL1419]